SITDVVVSNPDSLLNPTGAEKVAKETKKIADNVKLIADNVGRVTSIDPVERDRIGKTSTPLQAPDLGGMTDRLKKDATENAKKGIQELQKESEKLAGILSGTVAPAFQGMFDAILAGEAPLKSFFDGLMQGVKNLINQLIQAAIQAAFLSLITNAIGGGAAMSFGKAFGQVTGFGGTAGGGGFGGPQLAGAMNRSGAMRGGGLQVNVSGTLTGQGSTLNGVIRNDNNFRGIVR
ncbi:MAG TPA: hypothetical protein VGD26_10760, partial [Chitinophagaceae bacterium]